MNKVFHSILIISLIIISSACAEDKINNRIPVGAEVKIKIIIGQTVLTATMNDNATTKDFLSMLPLTLKLDDYAKTEKISYLPRKLFVDKATTGSDPSPGDITYYSPWGNLAIFYKDFGFSNGLIILGKLDSGIDLISKLENSTEIRIER